MWYNKSIFGFILRKCFNKKYLSDWKDTSESIKDGKLTTYLFLRTNFKLEKISHISEKNMNIENPFANCAHPLTDFSQKLVDTPIYPEIKEYVKIVQIK